MFSHVQIKPVKGLFRADNQLFRQELKLAVDRYFADSGISRYATPAFWFRAILMLFLYSGSYLALMLFHMPVWTQLLLCVFMGLGLAGVGFSISHQASHGAFSASDKVNRMMSLSFNLVGMSDYMWHMKHDVFHHSYTNVYEWDEALKEDETFRFSDDAPWQPKHRYQHIYGLLAYAVFTIAWALWLDIDKWIRYRKYLVDGKHPIQETIIFWTTKLFYIFTMFVLPIWVGYSIWQVMCGYLIMNVVGSSLITHVLQVEHLNEETWRAENRAGAKAMSWSENQLLGTSNFRTSKRWFNWYIAGVNMQIEHHLFPGINAAHYPALQKIIQPIAEKYGLKYMEFQGFRSAILSHYKLLRRLGKPQLNL